MVVADLDAAVEHALALGASVVWDRTVGPAESVYKAAGLRGLDRILEFVPSAGR